MSRFSVQQRHADGAVTFHDIVWRHSRRFPTPPFGTAYAVWVGDTYVGDVTASRPVDFEGWTAHAVAPPTDLSGPSLLEGFRSRWYATQYLIGTSPQFRRHEDFEEGGFGLDTGGVLRTLETRLDSHRTVLRPVTRDGDTLIFREHCYVDHDTPGVTSAVLEHRITVATTVVPGTKRQHGGSD